MSDVEVSIHNQVLFVIVGSVALGLAFVGNASLWGLERALEISGIALLACEGLIAVKVITYAGDVVEGWEL